MESPVTSLVSLESNSAGKECMQMAIAVHPLCADPLAENDAMQLLHPEELKRALAMRSEVRKVSFINGRIAAKRAMLAIFPGITANTVNITTGPVGEPVVVGLDPGYSVSIAHSDHHAAAIVFPVIHPMGIDIETPHEKNRKIISSILSQSEMKLVDKQDDTLEFMHVLWTAKEAAGKAAGLGFRLPMEQYETESVNMLIHGKIKLCLCYFRKLRGFVAVSCASGEAVLTVAVPAQEELIAKAEALLKTRRS